MIAGDVGSWKPAMSWLAVAGGLAVGAALHGGAWTPVPPQAAAVARVGLPVLLVAVACTRPRFGGVVWVVAAMAVVLGGARAGAIDHAAAALPERALTGTRITLTEPLAASSREHASTAAARLGGRSVVVSAPRYGAPTRAMPRGAIVAVTGGVEPLGTDGNDARLRRKGVAGRVLASAITWDGARRAGVLGAIDRFADAATRTLTRAVGARRGALLAGMALGVADDIPDGDQDALRTSGLWHLVAASGGNIALVVALVMAVGWVLGVGDRWRLLTSAVAVCAYVPLAGAGPSIVRAGVMGLVGLTALAVRREHRTADALALAAALTLCLNPRDVLDVGWQLSFAASAALLLAAPSATAALRGLGLPTFLAAGLACTLVATVATAPITLLVFGQLSVIGLVANALAIPLVGIAVWSGAVAALLTPLSPLVAGWAAAPGGQAAGAMLTIADWSSTRSFAVVGPAGAGAILAGILLAVVVRPPRAVVALAVAAATVVLAFSVPRAPGAPRLLVLDIGQGSAALLQDGDDGVLVDAGPQDGGVVAELRKAGIRHLKAMVLSHPAADHDGGGAAVLAAFPTDLVLDGGEPGGGPTHDAALRVASRRGVRVEPVRAGQTLAFGAIALRVRWPTPAATRRPGDPNDRAAVIDATVGTLHALLPADAEGNVLRTLPGLRDAVLVVSHHGSADPDLPAVLSRVRPQVAVISVGAHNSYGHPAPATVAALAAARVPTLRTDQAGSIEIRADASGRILVRTEAS
ncbi:MAG: ComEC/Rec2 family competence protein [Solirubrobacteraceae bacterium]|nr:ComEC/Rec2 family competence protein [Patulibacter sp.]